MKGIKKLRNLVVLIGIPVGVIAFINLPIPEVQRPFAERAPLLLLPSTLSMEFDFKQAIATLEEAQQLLGSPTSAADIERGEEKLQKAEKHLNKIPLWFSSRRGWGFWSYDYNWRYTQINLQEAHAQLGALKARIFQEKNAQDALNQLEQSIQSATERYRQAKTVSEQQGALQDWQKAIDGLYQLPQNTLAGEVARQKISVVERDFQAVNAPTDNQQLVP